MVEAAYRELDSLIAEGAGMPAVRSVLKQHPPEERSDLCRYAWGLLDGRYGAEDEAALWLYAWALEARQQRRGDVSRRLATFRAR